MIPLKIGFECLYVMYSLNSFLEKSKEELFEMLKKLASY